MSVSESEASALSEMLFFVCPFAKLVSKSFKKKKKSKSHANGKNDLKSWLLEFWLEHFLTEKIRLD